MQHALLPSVAEDSAQSRGGREQNIGQHQPQDRQQPQCQSRTSRVLVPIHGILVGNKGSDAHHLGAEFLNEAQVPQDHLRGLTGRAHHEAASGLVADVLQIPQAAHPVFQRELLRMEQSVVVRVRRLVAEKIAVRARVKPFLVSHPVLFSHRKGQGAVGELSLDGPDQLRDPLPVKPGVLAALEHEGPKSKTITRFTAAENLLLGQSVAAAIAVAPPDAAVVAVIAAVIGKFNETADEDPFPVDPVPDLRRLLGEIAVRFPVLHGDESQKLLIAQGPHQGQSVDQVLQGVSSRKM